MNFQTFVKEVKAEIQQRCPDKKVMVQKIYKNNDIILTGMTIIDSDKTISPTMYLENYFKYFNSGDSLEGIVNHILSDWEKNSVNNDNNIIDTITNYNEVKERTRLRLINKNSNSHRLKTIPYKEYLEEFAVICTIDMELCIDKQFAKCSTNVTNSLLETWGISSDELFKQAYENTQKESKPYIRSMTDVLKGMVDSLDIDDTELTESIERLEEEEQYMIILSNESKIFGATVILFDEVMQKMANEIGHSFYMIPSSIHEWIILKQKVYCYNIETIKSMIAEVNNSELDEQEKLSDNLYMYDYKEKKIKLAE